MSSNSKPAARDPYLVKSVVHASQLLSAFRSSGEALPLREIAARSGLPKSMAFRLLYTLERCGMIEKVGENLYRSHLRPFKQRPYPARLRRAGHRLPVLEGGLDRPAARGGRAGHRAHLASTTATTQDRAAQRRRPGAREGRPGHRVPDRRARRADRRREVPRSRHSADRASRCRIPGATYFGANNYEAGLIGGRHLGRWAKQQLARGRRRDRAHRARSRRQPAEDAADRHAGRHEGDLSGARELPGDLSGRRRQARRELRGDAPAPARQPRARGSWSARSTIPARSARCARCRRPAAPRRCADHGPERVARRARRTAPAGHAPDRIGRLLSRRSTAPRSSPSRSTSSIAAPVPPAVFVKHQLVTPENVDHIYPNDQLIQITEGTLA